VVCFPAPAITRFPKFVIRLGNLVSELRKAKGTGKPKIVVPLFDLKFLIEFAAGDAGTSNRRH
jgi:hypothetical protein